MPPVTGAEGEDVVGGDRRQLQALRESEGATEDSSLHRNQRTMRINRQKKKRKKNPFSCHLSIIVEKYQFKLYIR